MQQLGNFTTPTAPPPMMGADGENIKVFPDGSAVIEGPQHPTKGGRNAKGFYDNLVDSVDPFELSQMGQSINELIKEDIRSQEPFRQGIANIVKLLGLSLNKTDGSEPETVELFSTTLFETVCHIVASAVGSLLPSQGISKSVVFGKTNDELDDRARNLDAFYDWYLIEELKGFRKEMIRTLIWAIIGGSIYKKVYIDPLLNQPTSSFIRIDDFIINRDYSSHYSSPRRTQILRLSKREFEYNKHTGFYNDAPVQYKESLRDDDNTQIQEELDAISGTQMEGGGNYTDGGYILYECHLNYFIKSDPLKDKMELSLPYVITIDSVSGNIVRLVRSWQEEDERKKAKEYFVNYSLLPSLDGEGYGVMHYAGGAAEAATAIQRLIIKSATYASFPAGFYTAGTRLENNSMTPDPGQYLPLAAGGLKAQDLITSLPYRDPSPIMMELKKEIEDSIRAPSSIINDTVAEMAPNAPSTSVLAILEALQRVPNLILQNFHHSFGQELKLFRERFYEWLEPGQEYPFLTPGMEHALTKEDFSNKFVIVPSSDPSMQNSAYRLMVAEILLTKSNEAPDLHNRRNAYESFYKNLNLTPEQIEKILLPPPEEEKPTDPVHENADITNGKPVKAFIFQDHEAHMTVHQPLAMNQDDPQMAAAAMAHIKEHQAFKDMLELQARMGMELPQNIEELTPEEQNHIAVLAAQATLQMQQEQAAANPPPEPPIDPGRAMIEDSKIKAQTAQNKLEFDLEKLKMETEMKGQELDMKQRDAEQKQMEFDTNIQLKLKDLEIKEKDLELKEVEMKFKLELEAIKQELAHTKMHNDLLIKERQLEHQAHQSHQQNELKAKQTLGKSKTKE